MILSQYVTDPVLYLQPKLVNQDMCTMNLTTLEMLASTETVEIPALSAPPLPERRFSLFCSLTAFLCIFLSSGVDFLLLWALLSSTTWLVHSSPSLSPDSWSNQKDTNQIYVHKEAMELLSPEHWTRHDKLAFACISYAEN